MLFILSQDNPKGSHSVEALISKPHDKARLVQKLGHNTEIESSDANKERGKVVETKGGSPVNLVSTREEHPKTLPDKDDNTVKDDEKVKKEESPMKEAMDLSVKQID